MQRIDRNGTDITDSPEKWQDTDWEMTSTNYAHPSITRGQHTNGPATVWVRRIGGEWVCTEEKSFHRARQWIMEQEQAQ